MKGHQGLCLVDCKCMKVSGRICYFEEHADVFHHDAAS